MNFKMILRIQSQALFTFAAIVTLPIIYSLLEVGAFDGVIFFGAIGLAALGVGIFFFALQSRQVSTRTARRIRHRNADYVSVARNFRLVAVRADWLAVTAQRTT